MGVLAICNSLALEVEVLSENYLKYKFSDEDEWVETKIEYEYSKISDEIEPCFYVGKTVLGEEYFLSDFVRI